MIRPAILLSAVCALLLPISTSAQQELSASTLWTIGIAESTDVIANVTYTTANGHDYKLDVYRRVGPDSLTPVVVNIHGGGWVVGTKEGSVMNVLPYLSLGCSVVNVEYRLASVSLAPAAVEDCRLALRWVIQNARKYHFDTNRIIVTGGSAGGHLALMTGMLDSTAGFDAPTDWDQLSVPLHVAAVINWFGITDVRDLLSGPNRQQYAVSWLGSQPDREHLADRVSPMTYVRKGLPPILSIHGDRDELVPYAQAVRLHRALTAAGVQNQLITIPGGGHGGFSGEQRLNIYRTIREFLKNNGILR